MKSVLVLILVILLSLLGYRYAFADKKRTIVTSPVFLTELIYVSFGLVLGPSFLGFFDEEILEALSPLVFLGLGWIGMLFGIQLNFRDIKRFPKSFFGITIFQGLFPLIFVFLAFIAYFAYAGGMSGGLILSSALIFGAVSVCTSQTAMAMVSRNIPPKKRGLLDLLRYISSLDDILAIPFLALAFAYEGFHTIGGDIYFRWWDVVLATIMLGLLSGFILNLLIRMAEDRREIFLLIISIVILFVGISRYLNISPIFIAVLAGMILANLCPNRDEVTDFLIKGEKPIFLIFLIISGALLEFVPQILIVVPLFIIVRLVAKSLGGAFVSKTFQTYFEIPKNIGLGLVPQGSLSLAIALSFAMSAPQLVGTLLIFSVTASVLFHEPFALLALNRVLENEN